MNRGKCISAGTIWAIGFKTSRSFDGGRTWDSWNWFSPFPAGQKRFIPGDFEILDSDNIWVVGGAWTSASDIEGVLIRTGNSRGDWSSDLQVAYYSFHGLSVVSGKAWISGRHGLIMHRRNIISSIGKETEPHPTSLDLHQNYPNPFNTSTIIEYALAVSGDVGLEVFDVLGRKVRSLVKSNQVAGPHRVNWNGMNDARELVTSGMYIYRMTSDRAISSKKIVLIR